MNVILLQGRVDMAETNKPKPEPVKPVKAHVENAMDKNCPWRF